MCHSETHSWPCEDLHNMPSLHDRTQLLNVQVHERHRYVILEGFRSDSSVNLMLAILHQKGKLVAPCALYPHTVAGNPSLSHWKSAVFHQVTVYIGSSPPDHNWWQATVDGAAPHLNIYHWLWTLGVNATLIGRGLSKTRQWRHHRCLK